MAFAGTQRYQIRRQLGEGGFGVVYEAYDQQRDQRIALKALRELSAETLYRFKSEFRALAHVTHPNLVGLYDLESADEQWFFTMELVEGVHFSRFLRGRGTHAGADDEALWSALRQLVDGVRALHAAGKLHRDIKPSNVLVTESGRVVLLDFGLVVEKEQTDRTTAKQLIGTPEYLAPELAVGEAASEAADWYSVGVMLYEALSGRLPYEGRPLQLLIRKQLDAPTPIATYRAGVAPELEALCMSLLAREPADRPSGEQLAELLREPKSSEVAIDAAVRAESTVVESLAAGDAGTSAGGSDGSGLFVGRRLELARLKEALSVTRRGEAKLVRVRGRSGIGKSALVERFLVDLERWDEALVLRGRCYERESVPYKALDSLVDALARALRGFDNEDVLALLPRDVWALQRLFPVLARVPAVAAAPRPSVEQPDQQAQRRRGFAALRELLARLCDRRSLVLSIDDVQWTDRDSVALISELLSPEDRPRLLLILVQRDEEVQNSDLESLLADEALARATAAEDIELEPLPSESTRELARALLARQSAGAGPGGAGGAGSAGAGSRTPQALATLLDAIAAQSNGVPFFVGELARFSAARAKASAEDGAEEVELTLERVLDARLSGVSDSERALLEIVAVSGQPLAEDIAIDASGQSAADGRAAIKRLRAAWLLRGVIGDRVDVYHDQLRALVLDGLDETQRAAHHRTLAFAMERQRAGDAEALAGHWQSAGEPAKAARYAADAAGRAADALAFDRAAQLYRLALELVPPRRRDDTGATQRGPAAMLTSEHSMLQERLADALVNAGRGVDAAQAYLAASIGWAADDRRTIELKRRAAVQLLYSGRFDEGLALLREALDSVGLRVPRTTAGAIAGFVVRRGWLRLRGFGFREVAAAELDGRDLAVVDACWDAASGSALIDIALGAAFSARYVLAALRLGEPSRVGRALCAEATACAFRGGRRVARVEPLLRRADAMSRQVDDPELAAHVRLAEGLTAGLLGQHRRALEGARRAEAQIGERCTGMIWELNMAHAVQMTALSYLGELLELRQRLEQLLKEAEARGDIYSVTTLPAVAFQTWMARGETAEGRRRIDDAVARWSSAGFHLQHFGKLISDVSFSLYDGEGDAALQTVERAWPAVRASRLLFCQPGRALGFMARSAACVAAAQAEGGSASRRRALLRQARGDAKRLARLRMSGAPGLSLARLAGAALVEGDDQRAVAQLAEAESALARAEMPLFAASAAWQRGRIVGGDAGANAVAEAEATLGAQGVQDAGRFAAALLAVSPRGLLSV